MKDNYIVVGVGSNIDPQQNVPKAKQEIHKICDILKKSQFIYTKPQSYPDQPDFLNGVLLIKTNDDHDTFKRKLNEIEQKLGRIRTKNKNAPRTIDLDILIYNGIITDNDVYERDFLQPLIRELLPNFSIDKS